VTLLVLYLLALLDGLLCGLRTSMGGCPLIRKRGYYVRALVRGIVAAQVVTVLALAALVLTGALSPHRNALRADLESAAERMLRIFLPYAALVLLNLALRLLPSTDIRSATSVFHARAAHRHPASGNDRRRTLWTLHKPLARNPTPRSFHSRVDALP
jgi:hypothetical protein